MELLYFAQLRETIGYGSETLSLPKNIADVAGLIAHLREKGDTYRAAFDEVGKFIRPGIGASGQHGRSRSATFGQNNFAKSAPILKRSGEAAFSYRQTGLYRDRL